MKPCALALILLLLPLAAPVRAAADGDVREALGRVLAAGGFRGHVEGALFGPGTPAVSGSIDAVFPDRIHLRSEDLEFVVTARGAWISALGYWTPVDRSVLPVSDFDMAEMRRAIAAIRDVREEGRATSSSCGDIRVYRFRATGQLPGARSGGDIRLSVCENGGRPSRLEASQASGERVVMDFDWTRRPQVGAPGE